MDLNVDLVPKLEELEHGLRDFLQILKLLEKHRLFEPVWIGLNNRLWDDSEGFLESARQAAAEFNGPDGFQIFEILNNPDSSNGATVLHSWNSLPGNTDVLSISIRGPHPKLTYDARLFAGVCEIILDWRPVQHMSLAWPDYRMDLQPLDAHRRGLGWLGWVPFDIAPAQVPEAQICRPMRDGTFIGLQNDLWFSHGPNADPDAVRRAQALEHRLNRLGVLPTLEELKRGDWGRS